MTREQKVWMIRAAALQGVLAANVKIPAQMDAEGNAARFERFVAQGALALANAMLRACDEYDLAVRKKAREQK